MICKRNLISKNKSSNLQQKIYHQSIKVDRIFLAILKKRSTHILSKLSKAQKNSKFNTKKTKKKKRK